jgi:hypothetical protein
MLILGSIFLPKMNACIFTLGDSVGVHLKDMGSSNFYFYFYWVDC